MYPQKCSQEDIDAALPDLTWCIKRFGLAPNLSHLRSNCVWTGGFIEIVKNADRDLLLEPNGASSRPGRLPAAGSVWHCLRSRRRGSAGENPQGPWEYC